MAKLKADGQLSEPALVIAPTSLMSDWQREAAQFTPELRVLVLHGPDRHARFGQVGEHDLVLATYPLLPRDQQTLLAEIYKTPTNLEHRPSAD